MPEQPGGEGADSNLWRRRLTRALAESLPAEQAPPGTSGTRRPRQPPPRRAGVLIPIAGGNEPSIYFTQRSNALRHHPGQISFPGGSVEDFDASTEAAALREAHEEIGLDPDSVEILGRLPQYRTVTGFDISPYVGWIAPGTTVTPDQSEVVRIFSVPLEFALDHRQFSRHELEYDGRQLTVYSIDYDDNHIWGATAGMLYGLLKRLAITERREMGSLKGNTGNT